MRFENIHPVIELTIALLFVRILSRLNATDFQKFIGLAYCQIVSHQAVFSILVQYLSLEKGSVLKGILISTGLGLLFE